MSSILVFSVMCSVFAAEFKSSVCYKLYAGKKYAEIVEYVKTNNEYSVFSQKCAYGLFSLVEQGHINKTLTKDNFVSVIDAQIAKIHFSNEEKPVAKLYLFCNAQYLNVPRYELSEQFEKFYSQNTVVIKQLAANKKYAKFIAKAVCIYSGFEKAKNYERMFEFSLLSNDSIVNKFKFLAAKNLGKNKIVELCNIIAANPTEIINTPKELNQYVDLTKKLNDAKYDNVVKPFYTKLKRVFYQNLTKGDDFNYK